MTRQKGSYIGSEFETSLSSISFILKKILSRIFLKCISIIFLFISFSASAQENRIVFSHLDVNDGLSENWIKCIIKDRNGFIWFGTNTGLNRYDGYEFEVYLKNSDDSSSVSDNEINAIAEDKDGNLWIGTRSGVNVLDISTYKFRRISLIPSAPLTCQDINYIPTLASDSEGNIWIGTHNGLFYFNQGSKTTAPAIGTLLGAFFMFIYPLSEKKMVTISGELAERRESAKKE
jgi:ligand-binding sensor domain-containing protein